jgi:amino-acid N-acetyltransferase
MSIDKASTDDAPAISALLAASDLPTSDLTPALLENFLVQRHGSSLVAVGGLEWAGSEVLLRSVAVARTSRGGGAGKTMVAALEHRARQRGAKAIFLLTTGADRYFAALGYRHVPREDAPSGIRQTAQFAGLCPSSSAFMVKVLEPAA